MWDISVAGHISSGESSEQGALREIKEEIGINVSVSDLKYLGTVVQEFVLNNGTYFDNELNDIYIFKLEDGKDLKIQEEELDQLKWLPISEFQKWINEKRTDLVPHDEEYKILFKYLESYI
jgi:8-oxo-dGTP pyrophosphatase MutT (NUDIX family)